MQAIGDVYRQNPGRGGVVRALLNFFLDPRKKIALIVLMVLMVITSTIFISLSAERARMAQEMEAKLGELQSHLQFFKSQYLGRQQQVLELQEQIMDLPQTSNKDLPTTTVSPEIKALLRNFVGTKTAEGVHVDNQSNIKLNFIYQLLPHLMKSSKSLEPSYLMKSNRSNASVVVGVPTVQRHVESYLLITMSYLIAGLTPAEYQNTIIVVMIGETDLTYIMNTTKQLETHFPAAVNEGLIEVIAPNAAYYPDFNAIPDTLGDPHERVVWRTKQNLDVIYLMAYAKSRASFFLLLEDDVIAKEMYMREIHKFNDVVTVSHPGWVFIEYCHVGAIGKLFRSSELTSFITYVQLFYTNMPIDWLMENYLADRVCSIEQSAKNCAVAKEQIRPKYKKSLFQHIGLFSSLKGKLQKIKDSRFGPIKTFIPHSNPALKKALSDLVVHGGHTLEKAYRGETYFWGLTPKSGDVLEFWFENPTEVTYYLFRSGNLEHVSDKLVDTVVEVLVHGTNSFVPAGAFNDMGVAEAHLTFEPLDAIRLKVKKDSANWAILSEVFIKWKKVEEAKQENDIKIINEEKVKEDTKDMKMSQSKDTNQKIEQADHNVNRQQIWTPLQIFAIRVAVIISIIRAVYNNYRNDRNDFFD